MNNLVFGFTYVQGARENARPLQPRNGRPVKLYYQRWKTDEVYILKTGSGFGDASF